jgi:hypothetical protein
MLFAPPVLEPTPPVEPVGVVPVAEDVTVLRVVAGAVVAVVAVVVAPPPPPLPVPGMHCE